MSKRKANPLGAIDAVYAIKAPPAFKAVLLALARRCNAEMECWPSLATLARMTGYSRSQVIRILQQLSDVEAIVIRERAERVGKQWKQLSNLYTLNIQAHTLVAPRYWGSRKVRPKVVMEVDGQTSQAGKNVVHFPNPAKADAQ